jgi:hypothetical protein
MANFGEWVQRQKAICHSLLEHAYKSTQNDTSLGDAHFYGCFVLRFTRDGIDSRNRARSIGGNIAGLRDGMNNSTTPRFHGDETHASEGFRQQLNCSRRLNRKTLNARSYLLFALLATLPLTACMGGSSKSNVSVSVTPITAQVYVGLTAKFSASVTGASNTAVTWQVNGKTDGNSTVGTISTTGLYTAPSTVPSSSTATITAISQEDSNAHSSASVTILPAAVVAISPAGATVASAGVQQFQVLINGAKSTNVSWTVAGSGGSTTGVGTIDANGLFTAPLTPPSPNTVVVTATSTSDPLQSATANVTLVFGAGALQGQYAVSMQGQDSNGMFGRVGSIVLDGEGNVTSGVEDVTNSKGTSTIRFNSGTYTVGADGRGSLNLTNNTAGTISFYVVVDSNQRAFLVESDSSYNASGSLQKQDPTAFSRVGLSGSYVFDLGGVDGSTSAYVNTIVGRFNSDGAGHINNGQWDENDDFSPTGPVSFSGSSYQIDSTYGTNYGRATASINSLDFVFYIVDAGRSTFLQTDSPAVLTGDAVSQQSVSGSLSSLSGSYAFLISGSANNGPVVRGGRFTADGAGNLSNLILLNDYKGNVKLVPSSGSLTGTYTIDSTGTGRGTLKFTDGNGGSYSFIFYQASTSEAVFQDASTNISLRGSLLSQTTTTLSASTFAGKYALQWSGSTNGEIDGLGQVTFTSASSKNATGTFDYNDKGSLNGNLTFSGDFTLKGDGTSSNTLSLTATSDSTKAFGFYAVIVDPGTLFLVGSDTQSRPLVGKVLLQ